MWQCEVCDRQMSLWSVCALGADARERTYPFRTWEGYRQERPVTFICPRCAERGELYRHDGYEDVRPADVAELVRQRLQAILDADNAPG